ncbi:MAG: GxxExxY protein [Bacteroidota bacterium]
MTENEISNKIIGYAIDVHKLVGTGLLESGYQKCLEYELINHGFRVKSVLPQFVNNL